MGNYVNPELGFREEANLETRGRHAIAEVERLDPELLRNPETETMVRVGAQFIAAVTDMHGSPDLPKWYKGTREEYFMTYHNGESEHSAGHTSVGEHGMGVPRNGLRISAAMNKHAGREVVKPIQRARIFVGTSGHDVVQLCGRSIIFMKEGITARGERGDELESAQAVYDALAAEGVSEENCERAAINVLATIFDPDPDVMEQVVDYSLDDEAVLEQEITACADLLQVITKRGPRGAMEELMESLCKKVNGQILHTSMAEAGWTQDDIRTPEELMVFADGVPALREKAVTMLRGQVKFMKNFTYKDTAIRKACGAGIDELFPGREQIAEIFDAWVTEVEAGGSLVDCWNKCVAFAEA